VREAGCGAAQGLQDRGLGGENTLLTSLPTECSIGKGGDKTPSFHFYYIMTA